MITIDGRTYNIGIASMRRKSAVLDGPNSGRTLNGDMKRDIVGTYYNYTIEFITDDLNTAEYDDIYETLTAPVPSHTVKLPYGQRLKDFTMYVTGAEDGVARIDAGKTMWSGLAVNFIALGPARRP